MLEAESIHHRDLTHNWNKTLKPPRNTKTTLLVHEVGQKKAKVRPQSATVHKPR